MVVVKCWPAGIAPHLDEREDGSDGDGITDYYELNESPYVTNPQSSDTDNDGVTDSVDPAPLDGTQTTTEQAATYRYNHLGQRASKTVGGTTTYFVYSSTDGQMIGEYTSSGAPVREYLYLQGERVATVNHTGGTPQVRYVANDHVGQARYAWNDAGTMMFERTQTPFGESMAEQSYAKVPLRFPGQYYDPESGMNQNHYRDYDPAIGRYLQSDPIGLDGGINTYLYASANPVMRIDPLGLDDWWRQPGVNDPSNPWSMEHWTRNRHNKCPEKEPEEGCDKEGRNWDRDNWWSQGWYHGGWKGHNTYRSSAPIPGYPDSGFQCTYKDGKLIDSGPYMGTFDYGKSGTTDHWNKDVAPHNTWPHYIPDQTNRY